MDFYTNVSKRGDYILYRGIKNNVPIIEKYKFKPTLFVKHDKAEEWKSLYGEPLKPIKFDSMGEAYNFLKTYKDVSGYEIHGNEKFVCQFVQHLFPGDIKFDSKHIRCFNFDIEVLSEEGFPEPETADFPVVSIALQDSKTNKRYVWGLKEYSGNGDFEYFDFTHEKSLLQHFLMFWKNNMPDTITGWNIEFFDIPYLLNRVVKLFGPDKILDFSPWKKINEGKVNQFGDIKQLYRIEGVETLDYMKLFQKFTVNTYGQQENYRLDTIAHTVLGERKLDYNEYSNLFDLYEGDYNKFLDYNMKDVDLITRMEKKIGLLELVYTLAYMGGVNYSETLGTVAIWDSIIYRKLSKQKIAVPNRNENTKQKFPGGYVKEPYIGMHDWMCSFDLNSLYPNIMVQYNMSPETIVDGVVKFDIDSVVKNDNWPVVPDNNICLAASGHCFSTDQLGVFPEIVKGVYSDRVAIKNELIDTQRKEQAASDKKEKQRLDSKIAYLNNRQMALKILMNSLYGAISNVYFRYFDIRVASSITLTGQFVIKYSEKVCNDFLNKLLQNEKDRCVAIDTDSVIFSLKDVVDHFKPKKPLDFLDKFCSQGIEPVFEKAFEKIKNHCNCIENAMVMKREVIADKAIWTGAKHYILNVWDNEGVRYNEPKLKIKGIEAVKSSTPAVCRDELKDIFFTIMNKGEKKTQEQIKAFRKKFKTFQPEEIAFPRGTNDIGKWIQRKGGVPYKKGVPIHVRGSILYNNKLKELGLAKKYGRISNGDKVKFAYLKMPNPIKENVISFIDKLPEEFGLEEYIDYDTQFEKAFMSIVTAVTDAVGWNSSGKADLSQFFV